jgi:nucleoside-diphosphate-sugar epimerase
MRTDFEGTRVVLEAARRCGVSRVIFTSSISVYGTPEDMRADPATKEPCRTGAPRCFRVAVRLRVPRPQLPVLGSGKNLYQLLDVDDVCQAIHVCMT